MESLKEKFENNEYKDFNKTYAIWLEGIEEDVKEAVLKYKSFIKDLNNIGNTISKKEFQNKYNFENDLNFNYETYFNKIFGDFEK